MNSLFGLFNFSTQEILVLLVLGVLLFGRRLPEVGRYLGKGIVEFKKGMKGLEDDVDTGGSVSSRASEPTPALDSPRPPQRVPTSVPKFEDSPPASTAVTSAAPKFEDNAGAITTPPKS
ncbi:MAG: twin-arginine translocase TatA/TatE family subunit [Gemmataceae bacterium]|nr:twin-arginine translocase TatA/TatE family subunit [Gemmataceae bacterium]